MFHNVSFPLRLAFGASGGPVRTTHITALASGGEARNSPHAHSRRRYNAAAGIKSHTDLQKLVAFFEARFGQLYSFRFRDPVDYMSCPNDSAPQAIDQSIGIGDGSNTSFQIVKHYGDSAGNYTRKITKPVTGSVLVSSGGVTLSTSQYSVDDMSGVITFNTPPAQAAVIAVGYKFDVAVRFDSDHLDLSLEAFGAGELTSVPLIEVLYA